MINFVARSESRTGLQSVPPRFWRCGFGMGFHDILESFPTALLFRNHSLWQPKLMDSATTHDQQDAAAQATGILYGIFHLYGCQEPPQRFAIPLSPYHNPLLSFPQANALPAATNPLSRLRPLSKIRPCQMLWAHIGEMPLLWGARFHPMPPPQFLLLPQQMQENKSFLYPCICCGGKPLFPIYEPLKAL